MGAPRSHTLSLSLSLPLHSAQHTHRNVYSHTLKCTYFWRCCLPRHGDHPRDRPPDFSAAARRMRAHCQDSPAPPCVCAFPPLKLLRSLAHAYSYLGVCVVVVARMPALNTSTVVAGSFARWQRRLRRRPLTAYLSNKLATSVRTADTQNTCV